FRNLKNAIGIGEPRRPLIVQLGVLDIDGYVGQISIQPPLLRVAQWSLHRDTANHCRVTGQLISEVSAPQRVQIQMIHMCCDIGRIIALHPDGSVHRQRALGELGMAAYHKFPLLRDRLQEKIAGEFAIQGQIAHMPGRIYYWSSQRSRNLQGEVGATLDWQLIQVNLAHPRQIEILAREIEMESTRGWREGGSAGYFRILVRKTNVTQCGFGSPEAKIGIELFNLLAVCRSIGRANVTLSRRISTRSVDLKTPVRRSSQRIVQIGE